MAKRHRHRHTKKRGKSLINKTMNMTQNVSKKYMPKVKSGLENVGEKVITTSKKSVPALQRYTRKFLSLFTRKRR